MHDGNKTSVLIQIHYELENVYTPLEAWLDIDYRILLWIKRMEVIWWGKTLDVILNLLVNIYRNTIWPHLYEAVVDCWDTAICRAATPCHRAGSSSGASIINGGGEYVSLAEIFLRKLLRFCLSRLAIGSQNRTASGENSRCSQNHRLSRWLE